MDVKSTTYQDVVEEYRELLRRETLAFQQCRDCGRKHNLPRVLCAQCHGRNLAWQQSAGLGKIYTFSITYRAPSDEWADRTPYAIGLIDLDEGVRVMGHIDMDRPEAIDCDARVVAKFRELDGVPLLYFLPTNNSESPERSESLA